VVAAVEDGGDVSWRTPFGPRGRNSGKSNKNSGKRLITREWCRPQRIAFRLSLWPEFTPNPLPLRVNSPCCRLQSLVKPMGAVGYRPELPRSAQYIVTIVVRKMNLLFLNTTPIATIPQNRHSQCINSHHYSFVSDSHPNYPHDFCQMYCRWSFEFVSTTTHRPSPRDKSESPLDSHFI
jgi:hypothetical protein